MESVRTVGFIGLGMMGKPMALNLLQAGFPLVVHNRSHAPVQDLLRAGATDGGSPRGVAQLADVTIMCLPDSPDVQSVMEGPDGILAGARRRKIVIDMSTISPLVTRRLAEKAAQLGVDLLDAPVSGGEVGAKAGTLSIMVGGRAEALERVMPVLQALGQTIVHMGGSGAGQIAKACNQLVTIVTLEAVSEALVLAAKAGLEPAKVRQALLGGFGRSRVLELHWELIVDRGLHPGFDRRQSVKDMRIVMETGWAYGAPLPAAGVVSELVRTTGYACGEVV